MYVKIQLPGGKIIKRKVKFFQLGNFCNQIVRIQNKEYWLGDGDEYMRGYDDIYKFESLRIIGKELKE